MKFTNKSFFKQIEYLQKMHSIFNKELFNNSLKPIKIDIENCGDNVSGMYGRHIITEPFKISIDGYYVDSLSNLKAIDQRIMICVVLLHEMVHQYCRENGIIDTDDGHKIHNENYIKTARDIGYFIEYDGEKIIHEEVSTLIEIIIAMN